MISYRPLFETMKKRKVTTYALIHKHDINPRTVQNMKKNKGTSTYTIEKLCRILNCTPNDVIEVVDDIIE